MSYRYDTAHLRPDQQAIVRNRDENDKLLQESSKKSKDYKTKEDIRKELIDKYNLQSNKGIKIIIHKLWDKNGVFHQELVDSIISQAISYQDDLIKKIQSIFEMVKDKMNEFGLLQNIDYSLHEYDLEYISLNLKVKGNKSIIDYFIANGWVEVSRHFRDSKDTKVLMVNLKYVINEIFK